MKIVDVNKELGLAILVDDFQFEAGKTYRDRYCGSYKVIEVKFPIAIVEYENGKICAPLVEDLRAGLLKDGEELIYKKYEEGFFPDVDEDNKAVWVNFYNPKTGESFSYEESETVYVLKSHKDYDLRDDESRAEFQIDKIDSEKEIGNGLNKSYLIPVMAEYVKIGQTIYDVDLNYEGYRKE